MKKKDTKVYMYTPIEVTFDHENNVVYEACGLTEEQYLDIGRRYDEMIRETPRGGRSKFIQLVMDHFNPLEAMIIMDNVAETNKYRSQGITMDEILKGLKGRDD